MCLQDGRSILLRGGLRGLRRHVAGVRGHRPVPRLRVLRPEAGRQLSGGFPHGQRPAANLARRSLYARKVGHQSSSLRFHSEGRSQKRFSAKLHNLLGTEERLDNQHTYETKDKLQPSN